MHYKVTKENTPQPLLPNSAGQAIAGGRGAQAAAQNGASDKGWPIKQRDTTPPTVKRQAGGLPRKRHGRWRNRDRPAQARPRRAPQARRLLEEELALREFVPVIERICSVSSFSTPSTWTVETDRGAAQLVLKGEEDIRRLRGSRALLIAASDGVQYAIEDTNAFDKASRRLLERFL